MVKAMAWMAATWLAACGGEPGDAGETGGGETGGGETSGTDAAGDPAGTGDPATPDAADETGDGGETTGGGETHAQPASTGNLQTDAARSNAAVIDDAGRIGFRADVQMELETLPGTPAEAVQKMGGSVQRRMTEIRTCYDRAVASDPEIQGTLKLLVETNARRVVSADVTEAGLERGRITDCVIRILRRLPRAEVPASARLWVVLRASNTMAAGMSQVRDVQ